MAGPDVSRFDVPVQGGPLATFRFGAETRGMPVIIAAHGITANSRAWLPVARALGTQVSLIAPDLRGRGASNALPGPFGTAALAADLLVILDALDLERAVVVGHSLGAYIAARLAAEHPERVSAVVLVDGGLTIPGSEGADPQAFADAFLGPALARLRMTFATADEYREWWRAHPAIRAGEVADSDLVAYADHDLEGEPGALRSSVSEMAVREAAGELATIGEFAHRLAVPAKLLCAPRGLLDDPDPMQPLAVAEEWAAQAPGLRETLLVPNVNHYTITLAANGAAAVASAINERVRA